MNNKETFLHIIETSIEDINRRIKEKEVKNVELMSSNNEVIEKILAEKDYSKMSELNSTELEQILPSEMLSANIIKRLNYYKTLSNERLNNSAATIEKVLLEINKYFEENIKKHEQSKVLVEKLKRMVATIKDIKSKVESDNYNFTDEELDQIYNILVHMEKGKAIDIFASLGKSIINSNTVEFNGEEYDYDGPDLPEEVFERHPNQPKSEAEIVALFQSYGLSYKGFLDKLEARQKDKEKIRVFREHFKIDVVKGVLEALKKINVLSQEFIEKNANDMRLILLYSTGENITEVMDKITVESNGNQIVDFQNLITKPLIFIERKRRYKRRDTNFKEPAENNDPKYGRKSDFFANLELFCHTYNVPLKDFCDQALYCVVANQLVKDVIKAFDFYGINPDMYINKPSCFYSVIHQPDVLDQFIELGLFSYIITNASICRNQYDNYRFYRLIYARKILGYPIDKLIEKRSDGLRLKGIISDEKYHTLGINEDNKRHKINQKEENYADKNIIKYCQRKVAPLAIDTSLSENSKLVKMLDENFLKRIHEEVKYKKNDKAVKEDVYYDVYDFGESPDPNKHSEVSWPIQVSRKKVLRVYNELIKHFSNSDEVDLDNLETYMYVITRQSLLTEEEYAAIKEQVSRVYNNQMRRG